MAGSGKEEPCLYKEVFYFSQRQVGSWQRAMDARVFLQQRGELSQTHLGGFVQRGLWFLHGIVWNRAR